MNDILPLIAAIAAFCSTAAIAFVWSKLTQIATNAWIMRLNTILILAMVTFVFLAIGVLEWICSGSALKGFGNCSPISTELANAAVIAIILAIQFAVVWLSGTTLYCAVREFLRWFKR